MSQRGLPRPHPPSGRALPLAMVSYRGLENGDAIQDAAAADVGGTPRDRDTSRGASARGLALARLRAAPPARADARREVPARSRPRSRGNGGRLRGSRHRPRPRRCDQALAPQALPGPRVLRAVPARGAGDGQAVERALRTRARHRGAADRGALPRDGAARRHRPGRAGRERGAAPGLGGRRLRGAGVRGHRGGALHRHRAPRPEAVEHVPGSAAGRKLVHQGARLRHRQDARGGRGVSAGADAHGGVSGLSRVYVARAAAMRPRRGNARRHLVARRHLAEAPRGSSAVRRADDSAGLLADHRLAADPRSRSARRHPRRAGGRDPALPPSQSRGAVSRRGRARAGAFAVRAGGCALGCGSRVVDRPAQRPARSQ